MRKIILKPRCECEARALKTHGVRQQIWAHIDTPAGKIWALDDNYDTQEKVLVEFPARDRESLHDRIRAELVLASEAKTLDIF